MEREYWHYLAKMICIIICVLQFNDAKQSNCLENCKEIYHSRGIERSCQTSVCQTGCKRGWYGSTCNISCSHHCKDSICDQIFGRCANGCHQGWTGKRCDQMCKGGICKTPFCESTFCERADDKDCKRGYYGLQCQYKCSSECGSDSCEFSTKEAGPVCTKGCKASYTGKFCKEFCPSKCYRCNKDDGNCIECVDGFYGAKCENVCRDDCDQERCKMDERCRTSNHKYSGGSSMKMKRSSPDVCLWRNNTKCLCCKDGHRGDSCSEVFKNYKTYFIPGTCDYYCKAGYYGTHCNNTCPETCSIGLDRKPLCEGRNHDSMKCLNWCIEGRYGQQCNSTCSSDCKDKMCYSKNGLCITCNKNFYGRMCNKKCNNGCQFEDCHRNGTCTKGCKDGFVGYDCSERCPNTCSMNHSRNHLCSESNGNIICSTGCIDGYFGIACDKKCIEKCRSQKCDQITGICKEELLEENLLAVSVGGAFFMIVSIVIIGITLVKYKESVWPEVAMIVAVLVQIAILVASFLIRLSMLMVSIGLAFVLHVIVLCVLLFVRNIADYKKKVNKVALAVTGTISTVVTIVMPAAIIQYRRTFSEVIEGIMLLAVVVQLIVVICFMVIRKRPATPGQGDQTERGEQQHELMNHHPRGTEAECSM